MSDNGHRHDHGGGHEHKHDHGGRHEHGHDHGGGHEHGHDHGGGHGSGRGFDHVHAHDHGHRHSHPVAHFWIRAGLLAGFAFYVAHLTRIDKLQYYIVPRMIPYVKYAALALFVLAGYFAFRAISAPSAAKAAEPACDCGHEPPRSVLKNVLVYGLFALPLLFGFVLPDKIMGSDAAAVKGMNLSASGVQPVRAASSSASNTERLSPTSSDEGKAEPSQVAGDSSQTGEGAVTGNGTGADDGAGAPGAAGADNTAGADDTAGADSAAGTGQIGDAGSGGAIGEPGRSADSASSAEDELDKLFPADEFSYEYARLGKLLYGRDSIAVGEEGFLEILTLLDLYRDRFLGKEIVISGFVYREEGMAANQFVVSRMTMQCCSADAMPYGLLAEAENGAEYAKDAWIRLTGTLGLTEYNGYEILKLEAQEIATIPTPSDPYVYPYFDDFAKLAES